MEERKIQFEWDARKARNNLKKLGVSFKEAETVFDDSHAFTQADELHSDEELRKVIIGYSDRNHLLVVSFVERTSDRIRIISARSATQRERKIYEEASRI